MNRSVTEQLKAIAAARRKPALDREDALLNAKYAGQYVAYLDHWTEYELWRQVLAATPDRAEFERVLALLKASNGRVKGVGVPPAAPLPEPPPVDHEAIREKLRALTRKTPAQQAALQRAYDTLCEKYPGQHVAFVDEWNGEELARTVVAAAVDVGPFYEQVDRLPPDVRARMDMTRVPDPNVIEVRSVWFD